MGLDRTVPENYFLFLREVHAYFAQAFAHRRYAVWTIKKWQAWIAVGSYWRTDCKKELVWIIVSTTYIAI